MHYYRTQSGEVLDDICYRYYGDSRRYTESVLRANPSLADQPALLPADIMIALPALAEWALHHNTLRLWD